MKKTKIYIFIMVAVLLLSACQTTPEDDIVVNKNETKPARRENDSPFVQSSVPEYYQDSFQCLNDNITVTVDAEVATSDDDGSFSTISVKPHEITEDEVRKWGEVLFEGQIAYEPRTQYTKSELEKKILMLKKHSNLETLMDEYGTEEAAEAMQATYEKDIAYYESIYRSTPDDVEKKGCDWQFHPSDYYDLEAGRYTGNEEYESIKKTDKMVAVCVDSSGNERAILASKRVKEDYIINDISYFVNRSLQTENTDNVEEITKEEALNRVSSILEELGLENWTLWDSYVVSDEDGVNYHFNYTPTYNGVAILASDKDVDLYSEDTFAANYNYPSLMVNIRNGQLDSIYLTGPIDQVAVGDEDTSRLNFEKVYEAFKNQMQNKYTISTFIEFGEEDAKSNYQIEIKVNSIKEGLFRIKKKNEDNSFILVPTWVFIGEVFIDGSSWGESNVCYVNALDGSIIDPKLGY